MVGIKRRYNNVMMDTERQQQIEMFLGMKHSVYFPLTTLYYKEEPAIPLDCPETDDELDPVSAWDWVPDKGQPGQMTVVEPSKLESTPGHSRIRNKSYTSTELLWGEKAMSMLPTKLRASSQLPPHLIPDARMTSSSSASMMVVGSNGAHQHQQVHQYPAHQGQGQQEQHGGERDRDSGGHMHHSVSDPAMAHRLAESLNSPVEPQGASSSAPRLEKVASVGRSTSVDNLPSCMATHATSRSPTPSPTTSQGGYARAPSPSPNPFGPAPGLHLPHHHRGGSGGSGFGSAGGSGYGGASSILDEATSPRSAYQVQASGGSLTGRPGTPEPARGEASRSQQLSNALKQGWKKIQDPLGLLCRHATLEPMLCLDHTLEVKTSHSMRAWSR